MKRFILLIIGIICLSVVAFSQDISITGKVTAKTDKGSLPGVSVAIKGTSTGISTDIDGNFSLTVPSSESILIFSYIGFITQEVKVGSRTSFDIVLESGVK